MKIELWYDVVAQEIDIIVNDVAVEKNDIFGFLYPVRNYPLQTWLYPDGSWKGIEYQLMDLAREEYIELIFHGRKSDYKDIEKCLQHNEKIKMKFFDWNVCSRYDSLLNNLIKNLKNNERELNKKLSLLKINSHCTTDFDIKIKDSSWCCHIYDDADLATADNNANKRCCYVHESFFTSYDKLQKLHWLTRSLKMPSDAIYCCFKDVEKKRDYSYYARAYPKMKFQFTLETNDYITESKNKYGEPSIVNLKILKCSEVLKTLYCTYSQIQEKAQIELRKLAKKFVELKSEEKKLYEKYKQLLHNLSLFLQGIKQIYEYIDVLFSISKENKEEIFHYECINKLNEKIDTFLNIKSFGEVN